MKIHTFTKFVIPSVIGLVVFASHSIAAEQKIPKAYGTSVSAPYTSPLDSRIKYYAYTPDVVYTLPVTVGMHTHIQMGADEKLIEKPNIGETVQWRISGNAHNLYVKALQEDATTSLTLITNKRVYQFELQSTKDATKRVQKAYFTYPDEEQAFDLLVAKQQVAVQKEAERVENIKVSKPVESSSLTFYKIEGNASFKPHAVYDDGTFTYFRLPQIQDLPAIFMLEEGTRNKLSPLNYVVKGDQVIIERVAKTFVMKLGKDELRIVQGN